MNPSPLGNNPGANKQIPQQGTGKLPGWKNDAIYDSETPTSTAQANTGTVSKEDCSGDTIVEERKMDNAQQLAHRCKAYDAAQPVSADPSPALPGFEAGEIEYD